jgi:hypothetical protein
MYQSDRGEYRKKESIISMFYHSCLGKAIIFLVILCILAIVAYVSCPSERKMREEMTDDIRQCIERPDSIHTDWIDDAIANVGYIFTTADSVVDKEMWAAFNRYNRLEYYSHGIFSTMHVFNSFHVEGIRCGVGIFGVVIPTINFNDLVLRVGTVRGNYNYKPIEDVGDSEYFGETPDLIFREENY